MIFILPLQWESMIPGKIKSSLLDDDDFLSNNAWHLKGRDLFKLLGIKLTDVLFLVVVAETVKLMSGLLGVSMVFSD